MVMRCVSLFLLITVTSIIKASPSSTKYYIDGGALVIFNGIQNESAVSDVLESILYSQILANHAYDRFSEFTQWYAVNVRSFERVAWTMYSSDFKILLDNESSTNQEAVKKKVLNGFDGKNKAIIYDCFDALNRTSSLEKLFSLAISVGNLAIFRFYSSVQTKSAILQCHILVL